MIYDDIELICEFQVFPMTLENCVDVKCVLFWKQLEFAYQPYRTLEFEMFQK